MKKNWGKELIIALILLLLVLLYFWRLITPNAADQAVFIDSDFNLQYYPWLKFAFEQWRRGDIPLWNPHLNGGQPGLGDIQVAALYPINLLMWLGLVITGHDFTPDVMELSTLLHIWMASYFAYRLGRRITHSRWGGLATGVIYGFSGYISGFAAYQITVLQVSTWLPLLLLLLDKAWKKDLLHNYVLFSVVFAITALAGHPQWLIYTTYATLIFALLWTWNKRGPWRTHFLRWGKLLLALGLGGALAAAQLLPSLELFRHSHRAAELDYAFASAGLPPAQLPGLFITPGISSRLVFIGSVTLLLAALGIQRAWERGKLWLALTVVGLFMAFGGATIVHTFGYVALPGLSVVRDQYRIFYVPALGLAVLAGLGLSQLEAATRDCSPGGRRLLRITLGLLALAGIGLMLIHLDVSTAQPDKIHKLSEALGLLSVASGALAGILALRLKGKLSLLTAQGLLISLLILELFSPNWQHVVRNKPEDGLYPVTTQVAALQEAARLEQFRIHSESLLPGGPNSASVYGLEDIVGYTPLDLKQWVAFSEQTSLTETERWGLLNVRYVLTARDFAADGRFTPMKETDTATLYRFGGKEFFPRFHMVYNTVTVPDAMVWEALSKYDLHQTAILTYPDDMVFTPEKECRYTTKLPAYKATAATIDVETSCEGLLVFSEVFYPGWRAWIDGERTPVYRTNGLFRGVVVPAGTHRVELRFVPLTFWIGAGLSGCAWLVVGVLLYHQRRRRTPSAPAD